MNKPFLLIQTFVLLLLPKISHCQEHDLFNKFWLTMQEQYKDIKARYELKYDDTHCHKYWRNSRESLKNMILGKPNKKFLSHSSIANNMVRRGINIAQEFEELYLKECLSNETLTRLKKFKDIDAHWVSHECKSFDCSVNSLGHLFYAAKVFERCRGKSIKKIVEFGSGYGNLARILKLMEPKATIFLIDLPELIVLQELFLKLTLSDQDIILHHEISKKYKKGAIHLIPVYLLKEMQVDADVFISNFAMSESTLVIQKMIIEKNFFNAKICYLSGQLHGWGKMFEGHDIIFKGLRDCFSNVTICPFHIFLKGKFKSYEAIAERTL